MPRTCESGVLYRLLPLLLIVCGATGVVTGQSSLVARQLANGSHDLLAVAEGGQALSLAQDGLTFLPLALRGVALRDQLLVGGSRQLSGPAPAVRLPALGSLYRVSRQGQTSWMLIGSDGTTTRLAETVDGGVAALAAGISVDPGGQRALVCSEVSAGGDVWLLDLASVSASLLTAGLAALTVDDTSLRLGPDEAWFVADGQLYSADLLTGSAPTPIALPLLTGEVLQGELAMAADGRTVTVVAELTPGARRLFVVAADGAVTQVPGGPADYDLPGYAASDGPLLVMSSDGSCLAWRRSLLGARELFIQQYAQPLPPTQVTADGIFTDTIDIVGVLGFIGPTLLTFMAGEAPDPLQPDIVLGSADLYSTDMATGITRNITATSGELSPPFNTPGQLEVKQTWLDPRGERLLIRVDPANGDDGLMSAPLDGSVGLSLLLSDRCGAPTLLPVGERVLIRSFVDLSGPGNSFQEVHILDVANSAVPIVLLGSAPDTLLIDRYVSSRDGVSAAFVIGVGAPFELIVQIDAASQGVAFAWPDPLAITPALGFSPSGRLLAGLGVPGGPFLFASFSAPLMPSVLPVPIGVGFPLNP